jgi:hypothetical protein
MIHEGKNLYSLLLPGCCSLPSSLSGVSTPGGMQIGQARWAEQEPRKSVQTFQWCVIPPAAPLPPPPDKYLGPKAEESPTGFLPLFQDLEC